MSQSAICRRVALCHPIKLCFIDDLPTTLQQFDDTKCYSYKRVGVPYKSCPNEAVGFIYRPTTDKLWTYRSFCCVHLPEAARIFFPQGKVTITGRRTDHLMANRIPFLKNTKHETEYQLNQETFMEEFEGRWPLPTECDSVM